MWLVLWKAFSAVSERARESIRSLGIGQSDFRVLEVLLHKGPLPVNTIGPIVQLTSGSISVAIDRLEARQFVKRDVNARDKRFHLVSLTPKGRSSIKKAFARHSAEMEMVAARLTRTERAHVIRLLKKLGKHAGKQP